MLVGSLYADIAQVSAHLAVERNQDFGRVRLRGIQTRSRLPHGALHRGTL